MTRGDLLASKCRCLIKDVTALFAVVLGFNPVGGVASELARAR